MNPKVEAIIEQIKSKFTNIDTILLFGSARNENWTPESDVDIFLIDNSLAESREDIEVDGIKVEIQKDNFANLSKDIEYERGQLLNRNLSTMIAHSETISTNSEAELQSLKDLAQSVLSSKTNFTDEEVKMWRYSIDDYLKKAEKDLARNDSLAFYLDAHLVIQNALELLLATHGLYFPQPKHLSGLLQKTDPSLLRILQGYLSANNLNQKLAALKQLTPNFPSWTVISQS